MKARIFVFGMQVDDDLFYRSFGNKLIFLIFLPIFFLSILWMMKMFVKYFPTTVQARMLIFGMQVDDELFYPGIEISLLLLVLLVCIHFSFPPHFE